MPPLVDLTLSLHSIEVRFTFFSFGCPEDQVLFPYLPETRFQTFEDQTFEDERWSERDTKVRLFATFKLPIREGSRAFAP